MAISGNIAARLDRLVFSVSLKKLVALISLGGAFEFYDLFMTAYIAPGLVAAHLFTIGGSGFFAINTIGFLVFCTFAGMWAGAMVFGVIADKFGRRTIFTFSLLWYCLATLVMAFQHSAASLDLWRFIAAIGVGLEQVTVDTLVPELVPAKARGRAFALSQFIMFCAVPVVAFCGWLFITLHPFGIDSWRAVALVGTIGALAAWWLRLKVPESPRWLALHGHADEADKITAALEEKTARDIGHALPPPASADPTPSSEGKLAEIFQPQYRGRTAMLSVFNLMQSIAFYGFGSWVPTLLVAKGIHVTTSLEYAFIIALANPLGPLLGVLIADRIERKWQLVTAGISVTVFVLLFAQQSAPAAVIFFGVMVTLANNWISFATHNYQAELYPTRIRARAIGFVYSRSRLSAALAGLLINFFLARGGTLGVALFIGAAMTVMVITIAAFGPRTLRRGLEEVSP